MSLIDVDRRAVEAARRNIKDARARFFWADARQENADLKELDFIVMNPPFHDGGAEDQSLGKAFILRASKMLRKGGALWLTANRHLPYEAALKPLFREIAPKIETGGYKIFEARK
jgi:16S rRNA (guanine1207-N2)-methyltransferase